MKNGYYAIGFLVALGLSVAACGDRERREEPLSRAPSESVAPPAPQPPAPGEGASSPSGAEQEKRDAAREPGEQKSNS
jgi:hypothetical protein